jgi:hypothetical protein
LEQISADLRPTTLKDHGLARVLLINRGDVRATVAVAAGDPKGILRFDKPVKQVGITPGQKGIIDFYVEPRKRPWIGWRRAYPFMLRVSTGSHDWATLQGQLLAKPRISVFWLLGIFIALMFVIGALMFGLNSLGYSPSSLLGLLF